jgi:hypothetical protein
VTRAPTARRVLPCALPAVAAIVALGAARLPAQAPPPALRAGEAVRVHLTGAPSDRPVRGRVQAAGPDSVSVTLAGSGVTVRARADALPLERAAGRARARGAAIGALVGASSLSLTFLIGTRGEELGLGVLLLPLLAIGGGVTGAGVGALAAPVRWAPVQGAPLPAAARPPAPAGDAPPACPAWRLAPGSRVTLRTPASAPAGVVLRDEGDTIWLAPDATPADSVRLATGSASVEVRGPRTRTRPALIGAGAGLLLGVVGAATDPDAGPGDGLAIGVGNALLGAGAGALLGHRRPIRLALGCRGR